MPIRDRFRPTEHVASVHDLFKRAAPDEFHPETDAWADLLGAVDRDDVRMTHAGEEPALLDDRRRGTVADGGIRVDQLERHLAIEPGVPRPVDLAEGAAADALERAQMSPVCQRVAASAGRRCGLVVKRQTTVHVGERGQHPELREHGPAGVVGARFGACPVDRRAIEHRAREIGNESFTHGRVSISSASRTSARSAALRAASGDGLPSASASSSYSCIPFRRER